MSDPVAIVCVRGADPDAAAERRWRRRALAPHSVRAGALPVARPTVVRRLGGLRHGLVVLLLAGTGWFGVTFARGHTGDAAFSRRIGAGCEELEPCLSLEAAAERRADACAAFCGRAAAELTAARQMRFRAEERRAVRDHYRERERSEHLEQQRQLAVRRDELQRERAARAEEASRERQHQLDLEQVRQAHIDRRVAEERQRRVSYFGALGATGRALRLKRCLARSDERCDALTLDLIDAADDADERRLLAESNEGVVHPAPKPASPVTGGMSAPSDASVEATPDPTDARKPSLEPSAAVDSSTVPSS